MTLNATGRADNVRSYSTAASVGLQSTPDRREYMIMSDCLIFRLKKQHYRDCNGYTGIVKHYIELVGCYLDPKTPL